MTELATIHAKARRPTARHPRLRCRDRPSSPFGFFVHARGALPWPPWAPAPSTC